jgi:1,4-alpha-glucan branching enzyme
MTIFGDQDIYLFNEGTHTRLYEKLGARPGDVAGQRGAHFAVWAPNAESVSVIADFNGWTGEGGRLAPQGSSGVWYGFVAGARQGDKYKFRIASRYNGYVVDKADPFGVHHQVPPETASILWDIGYDWGDDAWMRSRAGRNALSAPISIYEVHLGSWRHREPGQSYSYREIAEPLAHYVLARGFTHVEFMPLTEYPFYASWGYQVSGYFAPTSRFGTPQDLMYLIDHLHQRGIGVIMDWVPAHFPSDEHGLGYFDGTHLFEHADSRRGYHPDWNSLIYNYGRHEVRSFLISSALFWLDRYHIDGLRVDGVASMLYLDYSRAEGEWLPNQYGGRENLEAIGFLRQFNEAVYREFPDTQTIAEESTAWPMVSRPTWLGGLGFGLKWDMGWMHDTLEYVRHEPIHRRYHHSQLTFRGIYAFHENFVLPLSHDEVVHGKGSLLDKMPGDDWQKFANLRALYGYMFATPGKKLLFMGSELAQRGEWSHDGSIDWSLEQAEWHLGVQRLIDDLNRIYRGHAGLHELDVDPRGFEWIEANDSDNSVLVFLRRGRDAQDVVLAICNFTPVPRDDYRVGVPIDTMWQLILDSDQPIYGGGGYGAHSHAESTPIAWHGRPVSLNLRLPPLSAIYYRPAR